MLSKLLLKLKNKLTKAQVERAKYIWNYFSSDSAVLNNLTDENLVFGLDITDEDLKNFETVYSEMLKVSNIDENGVIEYFDYFSQNDLGFILNKISSRLPWGISCFNHSQSRFVLFQYFLKIASSLESLFASKLKPSDADNVNALVSLKAFNILL